VSRWGRLSSVPLSCLRVPRQFINQELSFNIATNLRVGVHVIGADTPLWLDTVCFIKQRD